MSLGTCHLRQLVMYVLMTPPTAPLWNLWPDCRWKKLHSRIQSSSTGMSMRV